MTRLYCPGHTCDILLVHVLDSVSLGAFSFCFVGRTLPSMSCTLIKKLILLIDVGCVLFVLIVDHYAMLGQHVCVVADPCLSVHVVVPRRARAHCGEGSALCFFNHTIATITL